MNTTAAPHTVVLIHGLWVTPLSWEKFVERFESRGHRVLAPAWPGFDRDIEEVRRDTTPYDHLGVTEIADHYDAIIRGLDAPPIIMGHSFGGLITQLVVDRGLGTAAVAIDAAPIKGILGLPYSSLKVASVALRNPANRHKSQALTPEQFRYGFANTTTAEESEARRQRYAVPGPGRTLFQAGLANFNPHAATKVNVKNNDRAPLLLIAGEKDHVVPASTVRAAFKLYRHSTAVTEYKEFAGRSHFLVGEPGWEEVADYALDWAVAHAATPAAV